MKRLLIVCAAFGLVACHTSPPTSPSDIANTVKLDEKAGIAVETMYTAVVKAGTLAFRAGVVKPSTNPLVKSAGFCGLVLANQFTVTDTGSRLSSLECKLRAARDKTRKAYDTVNALSYDTAAREAVALGNEIISLIQGN